MTDLTTRLTAATSHDGPTSTTRSRMQSAAPGAAPSVSRRTVSGLALYQSALAVVAVVAIVGSWPVAAGMGDTGLGTLAWWGPDVTLTGTTAQLWLGMWAGLAGSLVQTIVIFGSRVGRGTLERSYAAWYLLRPVASMLLAVLFVAAVVGGQVAVGAGSPSDGQLLTAFVAGGLAGLFTDAVLQKMRRLLGTTSTEKPASEQTVPLAAQPTLPQPR